MSSNLRNAFVTAIFAASLGACVADSGGAGGSVGDTAAMGSAGGGGACIPGQTVACTCADGREGARSCAADGVFDACVCDGSAGSGGGSSASGGSASGGGGSAGDGGTSGGGGSDGGVGGGSSGEPIVSFSQDVVPIFQASCGTGTAGCHEPAAYAANADADCRGWLSLVDEPLGSTFDGSATNCPDFSLYERLLDVGAWSCGPVPGDPTLGGGTVKPYIVPGDPSQSYLVQRVTRQPQPCDLAPDAMTMPPVGTIADADLALIELWIEQGALDN